MKFQILGSILAKKIFMLSKFILLKVTVFGIKKKKNFVLPFLQKTQKTFRTQKQAVTISRIRASRNKKNVFQLSLFLITQLVLFYWSHQCSWTLILANSMQVSIIQKFCPIGTRTRGTRQTGNGSTKEFCSKPSLNVKKMVEDNHIKIKRMQI